MSPQNDLSSEGKRWSAEYRLKERELEIKEKQVAAAEAERLRSRWTNPLVLALLAAAIAAAGNAGVALINGEAQRNLEKISSAAQLELEKFKAEAARVLEVIKTGDPESAAVNLEFLLQAGLIDDENRRRALEDFLRDRIPGQGPVLSAPFVPPADPVELLTQLEGFTPTVVGRSIGFGHVLTETERRNQAIVVDGEEINIADGISESQALRILTAGMQRLEEQIDSIVLVPLTANQRAALVSLAHNVGLRAIQRSDMLRMLNAGEYDAVPDAIRRWHEGTRLQAYGGLVRRRQLEAALWEEG